MKNNFNKILITSFSAIALSLLPTYVNAAEFDWGKAEKSDNITKIPVILEVSEEEKITKAKFDCEVNSTEASCEIVVNEGGGVYETKTNTSSTFTYPLGEETTFPVGSTTLATLVITNSSSARLTNVEVSITNASIENISVEDKKISTEIGPKQEEKIESSDARFSNIKFSQGTMYPAFNADTTEYTIYNIADTINSVRITPTCNEGECDFTITGGKSVSNYMVTLNQGENIVNVIGTSEDGTNEITYKFTVIRGETTFNSPKLKELSFGEYTLEPSFQSDIREYSLTIPNQITTLKEIIKYESLDEQAKINITGLENLIIGDNTITITVDNISGEETYTYTIIVKRMNDQNIEVLKYINNEVTFNDHDDIKNTMDIEKFKIDYPGHYEKIIDGTYKFDENGDIITEEKPKEEEKKEPVVEDKKDNSKMWLVIGLIVAGLIIIGVSGFFIFKKKKPQKIEEIKEEKTNVIQVNIDEEEIDETGIEENAIGSDFSNDIEKTVDIDEALSDLMSTKQYEFEENQKQD